MKIRQILLFVVLLIVSNVLVAQATVSVQTFFGVRSYLSATPYSDGSSLIKINNSSAVYAYAHLTSAQTTALRGVWGDVRNATAGSATAPTDDGSASLIPLAPQLGSLN